MGGLVYSAFAFSLHYRSLMKIDRAYALGMSGGNGWQRLFEGTSWQGAFDVKPHADDDYDALAGNSEDFSERESSDLEMETDLEASWKSGTSVRLSTSRR